MDQPAGGDPQSNRNFPQIFCRPAVWGRPPSSHRAPGNPQFTGQLRLSQAGKSAGCLKGGRQISHFYSPYYLHRLEYVRNYISKPLNKTKHVKKNNSEIKLRPGLPGSAGPVNEQPRGRQWAHGSLLENLQPRDSHFGGGGASVGAVLHAGCHRDDAAGNHHYQSQWRRRPGGAGGGGQSAAGDFNVNPSSVDQPMGRFSYYSINGCTTNFPNSEGGNRVTRMSGAKFLRPATGVAPKGHVDNYGRQCICHGGGLGNDWLGALSGIPAGHKY